ncbi:MAG: FAD-dependent oxidoreductase [Planctomycetes bacterium]|nr:FAD-dependent oxidoreductase [Planctomycetota bacterium]
MTSAGARRAFVLGGGLAGIAAAFGLRDRGFAVTVLESRRWLGGRAFSSPDPATGWTLDNGPHVMLGCYRATRALLRRLGSEHAFQQDRRLAMVSRDAAGRRARLSLSGLPVPLAMPLALVRLPLPWRARLRALWGMAATLGGAPAHWTLADWFRRRGQVGLPDAWLWRPLCRAIMNVEPELASAADFLATLREAFAGRATTAAFWVPKRPWGEILGEPARRALAAAGVEVRLGARVAALPVSGGRVAAIGLADGERLAVGADDLVVSALPWFVAGNLVPGIASAEDPRAGLASSPIVSVFVETPPGAPPLPDDGPVVALVDGDPFHFVLRTPGAEARRFALLSGGGRVFDGMPVAAIGELACAQLPRHYPGFAVGPGARVRVRKEQHATFVAAPGGGARRPPPGRLPGGPANLRICGDWTATGLPATLEGAARSAAMALADLPS